MSMRAEIMIPLSDEDSLLAVNSIGVVDVNGRSTSSLNNVDGGVLFSVESSDVGSLRASINGFLKLFKVHREVVSCLNKIN